MEYDRLNNGETLVDSTYTNIWDIFSFCRCCVPRRPRVIQPDSRFHELADLRPVLLNEIFKSRIGSGVKVFAYH